MKIEQIYTQCLAHAAYYIESNGEAALIDPLRDTEPYLNRLAEDGATLQYIFETHFHADFVSGHQDLGKKTGAVIVYGPTAKPGFEARVAEDNQIFELGAVKIKVIHTPGHTLESACFLLIDENGKETALFSGDTLFLGDVGRPDLAQKAANKTQEELAGLLYESLYEKILPLADEIRVYPGHGAGSACGKNMMTETQDTLGNQKMVNYALNQPDRASFIHAIIDGLLPPPGYFGMNVAMNKNGCENLDEVLKRSLKPLSAQAFKAILETTGALIVDARADDDFARQLIPHSIHISLNGSFAPWAGTLIPDLHQPLLLIVEQGNEEEAVTRLARVGFDRVLGYLDGGFAVWTDANYNTETIHQISAEEFTTNIKEARCLIIDVRKPGEYAAGHLNGAQNLPLASIREWIKTIDPQEKFYLYCQSGHRGMMASGILQAAGFQNYSNIGGGLNAISQTDAPRTGGSSCTFGR